MAKWLYTLNVKDQLSQGDDFNASAKVASPVIEARIRALMAQIERHHDVDDLDPHGTLFYDLDAVADMFMAVPASDTPMADMNVALERLYDIGDEGHRVWIK